MKMDIKNKEQEDLLVKARENFIQGAGNIAVSLLGMLNRLCGQIYALLFLSPEPLSLDDIVGELKVSKGSVSINIRILEDFKLVRKVWIKGSRKDYYQAVDTLPKKIIKEFFDKMKRNIQDSLDMIGDCYGFAEEAKNGNKANAKEAQYILEKLRIIRSFYESAHFLFDAIYSGQPIDTNLIRPILEG